MRPTARGLVAGLIGWLEAPHSDRGHPRSPAEAILETLHFFLRDGVQWRELRAAGDRVCGATLRRALVVCAAIARLHADAAYHSAENRRLCAVGGVLPLIRQSAEPHGSGLGTIRCVGEHANAWLLANKRRDRQNDRLTIIVDALPTTARIFVIASQLTD